ncbi:uncharacterized protein LOC143278045 [Babylonia areolata]|uniref:uncharacterized protein LOC143278045 n=1 Tax=Babylonia areolata TaxID=304850 RepID=UPI003FD12723
MCGQSSPSSMKLEFLAMKWAITEKFRHYLIGATFVVLTDNNPLVRFQTAALGALEQRWASQLAQFNFEVKYRPGRANPADALSRLPFISHPPSISTPMTPKVALTESALCNHQSISTAAVIPPDGDVPPAPSPTQETLLPRLSRPELRQLQLEDVIIAPVLTAWPSKPKSSQDRQVRTLLQQHARLVCEDGVLLRQIMDPKFGASKQLVLPSTLRPDVLEMVHDRMGHQGYERTMDLLRPRVY